MIRGVLLLGLMILTGLGCGIRQREEALQQKENTIHAREQQLVLREAAVALREEQVLAKEKKLDSTLLDTAILYNAALPGAWAVKMICTETTCAGSAVGDTKNETWNFSYEQNKIIAKVMVSDRLARTYSGSYINGAIELVDNVEATSGAPATKIVVRLNMVNNSGMEGLREIVRQDCKIVYSLQLTKALQ